MSLSKQYEPEEIEIVYLDILRKTGRKVEAEIVKELAVASPKRKKRICPMLTKEDMSPIPYTNDEALALSTDLKLTQYQYGRLRIQAKSRMACIYPSYHKVLEAKKRCYPPEKSITITETGAEILLQDLLDHTTSRLAQLCSEKFLKIPDTSRLTFIIKWGMDGASGQSTYRQIFKNEIAASDDSSIFMISMVPLQLKSMSCGKEIWCNPSSSNFCRPIKFEFMKETIKSTQEQYKIVENQIKKLIPYKLEVHDKTFEIVYHLELSMLDGKSINSLTSTPSSNCNICDAKPSEINDLKNIRKKFSQSQNYRFGLSTLHCWIRFLECILKISYRLPLKKWRVTGDDKLVVKERKKQIKQIYKSSKGITTVTMITKETVKNKNQFLGLIIDTVSRVAGTSNNGNTARRFFADPQFAAETTGVNVALIKRFKTILITLSCGRQVDPKKFQKYGTETANLFCKHYKWFNMPPSIHKVICFVKNSLKRRSQTCMFQVLFHGAEVIKYFSLPIGFYCEEAQEARKSPFN